MKWFQILIDSIIISGLFNLGVFLLMEAYPHFILSMLPKKFKKGSTKVDRHQTKVAYCSYLVLLILLLTYFISAGHRVYVGTNASFIGLFWHGWIVGMTMNVGDAILLDLLYIHKKRFQLAKDLDLPVERFERSYFFKHLTFVEHCIIWPLLICPFIGFLFAFLVNSLI